MFYDDYLRYKNHYSKDIKKIKYKSHFYNLDKDNHDVKITKMAGNFDLFFNEEGQLVESITYVNKTSHAKYYYEDSERESNLYLIEETSLGYIYADTVSEFYYDFKNRIALQKICHVLDEVEVQINTVYLENKMIEFYDNINDENYSGYEVYTYENEQLRKHSTYSKNREKIQSLEYIYDNDKNTVTERDHDDNETLKFFDSAGRIKEYIYDYEGNKVRRKYEYIFNDKNDWVTMLVTDNNEPKFITDREIEYYDY